MVLGERRLASRGLAGEGQHSSSSSRINNSDRDDDRAAAAHGAAVDRVGCNQIYRRSVLRLAWPARCDWAWLVPLVARSPCGDETPFACSRAWDMPPSMPPCPHQAFISQETPLTRLSHCSPQVHVSFWIKFGLIMLCLPDVLPQCLLACLLRALLLHSLSLTNTNTRIPAKFIDPFTAAREDGVRYRAANVRLGLQASPTTTSRLPGLPFRTVLVMCRTPSWLDRI